MSIQTSACQQQQHIAKGTKMTKQAWAAQDMGHQASCFQLQLTPYSSHKFEELGSFLASGGTGMHCTVLWDTHLVGFSCVHKHNTSIGAQHFPLFSTLINTICEKCVLMNSLKYVSKES